MLFLLLNPKINVDRIVIKLYSSALSQTELRDFFILYGLLDDFYVTHFLCNGLLQGKLPNVNSFLCDIISLNL